MLPPQKQKQAVDSDAVERLGGELATLVGADWHRRDYGVAVSGGPDSMALLWLMASRVYRRCCRPRCCSGKIFSAKWR